jgi:hypothetical protein
MAYKSKATFWSETDAKFVSGSNQWTGPEIDSTFDDLSDSVAWEHQKYTMTTNTYDGANGNLQERTLTENSTLVVTGCEAGKYYTLIKKGAYTLTLPTSEFSASGSVTGSGTTVITFLYDGTDYYFSFSTYSTT